MKAVEYSLEQLEAAFPATGSSSVADTRNLASLFEIPTYCAPRTGGTRSADELGAGIELPPLDLNRLTAAVTAAPPCGHFTMQVGDLHERIRYDLALRDDWLRCALLPAAYEIVERPKHEAELRQLFHTLSAKGIDGPYDTQSGVGEENDRKLDEEIAYIRRRPRRAEHPTTYRWLSMAVEAGWSGAPAAGPVDSTATFADEKAKVAPIRASPFRSINPKTIAPRQPILRHFHRKFVSATIAPGGVGKSSLVIVEAISIAVGRDLIGVKPRERLKVWIWNGEDPLDELQRRVAAVCLEYQIDQNELEGWLFLNSGRQMEIVIAEQTREGAKVNQAVVQQVKATIAANDISLVIIDPFVSSHRVTENDNNAVDRVVKTWAQIADETNSAVELVHHARKTGGNDITVEDGRGASALLGAVRSARVLNSMSKDEARKIGISNRREYVRVDIGKANLAPASDKVDWFQLRSVCLSNGTPGLAPDNVGVLVPWTWIEPAANVTDIELAAIQQAVKGGTWRANSQAKDWVGKAIGTVLSLDLQDDLDRGKAKRIQRQMIERGLLVEEEKTDSSGRSRPFVVAGKPLVPLRDSSPPP